jgi:RNA polymerase sigma-70 factor (ECF subfamily)
MTLGRSNTISNEDWVARLKSGGDDATASLRARIRTGLGAALGGRSDVSDFDLEDFTQDAVVRVIERLDTYRGDSSFPTWAMAVALRVSFTALRRRRWSAAPLDDRLRELASVETPRQAVSANGERAELMTALRIAIATELSPRQRQVLLGELEGIPQVVLADGLSSTPGAIYKVSHDARKKLKAALKRAGFDTQSVREILTNAR